jgi:nucleotide-binding universal stress UspA family protein
MRKVLVALDETEASQHAADFVNEFFDRDTTEIIGLNVAAARVPWIPAAPYGGLWAWGYYPGYAATPAVSEEVLDEEMRRAEQEGRRTIAESGITDAEAVVERGDVVTAIAQAAEEQDADLIVVGTRDEGALKRVLFGSVSSDLVHQAPRPVLVVR